MGGTSPLYNLENGVKNRSNQCISHIWEAEDSGKNCKSYYIISLVTSLMVRSCFPGLQNDHKDVMKEIEEALHQLHAREKAKQGGDAAGGQEEPMAQQVTLHAPIARVDAVTQGSPACKAVSDVNDALVSG